MARALPVELHGDLEMHAEALAVSRRFSLAATYDAHYLALAARVDAELWTADQRLYNSVHKNLPWGRLAA